MLGARSSNRVRCWEEETHTEFCGKRNQSQFIEMLGCGISPVGINVTDFEKADASKLT
jgi:hypothetical protein